MSILQMSFVQICIGAVGVELASTVISFNALLWTFSISSKFDGVTVANALLPYCSTYWFSKLCLKHFLSIATCYMLVTLMLLSLCHACFSVMFICFLHISFQLNMNPRYSSFGFA
jgi:ABC-type anion transport system duplicated permease subunit